MISIERIGGQGGFSSVELRGKSTDEKPLKGIPNGSSFYEFDTKKLYIFDKDESEWIEQ